MKKSAVNKHIFIRDLKHSWPVWVGMSLVYVMGYIPEFLRRFESFGDVYLSEFSATLNVTAMFAAIADYLLVLLVFGFMNNPRSANFFFSLPIKRGSLYMTKLLACVTVTFIPALIAGIIPVIQTQGAPSAWQLMLHLMLAHVSFLGSALLCAVLIGQSVAFAVISFILQFIPLMLLQFSSNFLHMCLYGYSGNSVSDIIGDVVCPVNFFVSLSTRTWTAEGDYSGNVISLVVLTLLGIVCAALAYFVFKKRRAESAGDVISFKAIRPLFKYGIAISSAMFFTYLMASSFGIASINERSLLAVCLMIVFNTALGYFICEMLIEKKFNVFKGSVRGFMITSALLVVLACCVELDILGLETRVPEASEVESVYISASAGAVYAEPENIANVIALHEFLISQKAVAESDKTGLKPVTVKIDDIDFSPYEFMFGGDSSYDYNPYQYANSHFPSYIHINYIYKNGKTLGRSYSPSSLFFDQNAVEGLGERFYAITHTYECARQTLLGGIGELSEKSFAVVSDGAVSTKLEHQKAKLLYNAVLDDMKDMHIGVDEIAPPTIKHPETLMTSTVTIVGENALAMFEAEFGKSVHEVHDFPQIASNLKSMSYSVTLDTRASRTLALLNGWGIEVS